VLRQAQTANSGLHKLVILMSKVKIAVDTSKKKQKGKERQPKY